MLKILLCEDSPFFAQAIALVLKNAGYEVVHAADGAKGIETLHAQPDFNLILCDIQMPNMDGWGVARTVKGDPQFQSLPFIFLTGVSDMDSMDRATGMGVTDYFIKSNVSLDKLVELVRKYIGPFVTDEASV